jgi:tetratricopeptide (TPR) repeat protein
MLEQRQACLRQRLFELKAIAQLLPKAKTIDEIRTLASKLSPSPLEPCSSQQALQQMPPLPDDPATRRAVEESAQAEVATIKTLFTARKYDEALQAAQKLGPENPAVYQPLQAEALYYLGLAQIELGRHEEAEASLLKALMLAEASHHDRLMVYASLRLSWVTGVFLGKFEQSAFWEEHTRAAIQRVGGNDGARSLMFTIRGASLSQEGRYAEAADYFQEALKLAERIKPSEIVPELHNLTGVFRAMGKFDQAEATLRRATELAEKVGGRTSHRGLIYNHWTVFLLAKGDPQHALEWAEKALANNENGFDGDFSLLQTALEQLQLIYLDLRNPTKAMEYCDRELKLVDEPAERVVLARFETPSAVSRAHMACGTVLAALGRYREALAEHQKTVAMNKNKYVSKEYRAGLLSALGEDWLGLHQPRRAADYLERALKMHESLWSGSSTVADTRFLLARALWESGGDRRRSRQLAIEARRIWTTAVHGEIKLAEIDRWLAQHPARRQLAHLDLRPSH